MQAERALLQAVYDYHLRLQRPSCWRHRVHVHFRRQTGHSAGLISGPGTAVGPVFVCVCLCPRTATFQLGYFWPIYLARGDLTGHYIGRVQKSAS